MAASYTQKDALSVVDSVRSYELYAAQQPLEAAVSLLRATEALNKTLRDRINASEYGVRQKGSQDLKRALKNRVVTLVPNAQDIPCAGGVVCKVANRDPAKIKFELGVVLDSMRMCQIPDAQIALVKQQLEQLASQVSLKAPMTVKFETASLDA